MTIILQRLQTLAAGLSKVGIRVSESHVEKNVGVIPYTFNAKFEVVRALQKQNYRVWNLNPQVFLQRGTNPVTVTDTEVVLLDDSVPNWASVEKLITPLVDSKKLDFKANKLGILNFSTDDIKAVQKVLYIKNKKSVEFDLVLDGSGSKFQLYRPLDLNFRPAPTKKAAEPSKPKELEDPALAKYELPDHLIEMLVKTTEHTSKTAMLLIMKQLWREFNRVKFGSQLKEPSFGLTKNMGSSMRLRGRWWPGKRLLEMAPRTFNAEADAFLEIFLHEMCHQATSEISKVSREPEKGHGPVWKSWMVKVGLNPNRYDHRSNDDYEDPKTQQILKFVKTHTIDKSEIKPGLHCAIFNSKENIIRECVVIEKTDRQVHVVNARGDKIGFLLSSNRWLIPLVWLPKYRWDAANSSHVPDSIKPLLVQADRTYT